jgi:hypothetical protein
MCYHYVKKEYDNTENVKRFATPEEAKQYCQDLYVGKIDLAELRAEIQTDIVKRDREKNEIDMNGAEAFRKVLHTLGITVPDFLAAEKAWRDTSCDSRDILYKEA